MYVSRKSSVDYLEGSLRHEGRVAVKPDPPVISSGPANTGILVLGSPSVSARPSSPADPLSRHSHGCIHLWVGWGGVCGPLILGEGRLVSKSIVSIVETVFLALKKIQRWRSLAWVLVEPDYTTVMHYRNWMGWTRSRILAQLARKSISVVPYLKDYPDSSPLAVRGMEASISSLRLPSGLP